MSPRLERSLGQHHLVSGGASRPLIDWLRPRGERVVEIGPGGGALTAELVGSGARVLAVELDLAWAVECVRRLPETSLWVGDAVQVDWRRLPVGTPVVGNLPYNVSTAIIERLLDQLEAPGRLGFLVQLEVAERLCAAPRTAPYGSYSVIAQARATWRLLGRVRPGSFRPPPKVHSAFAGAEVAHHPMGAEEWPRFKSFVRACFALRRKTLVNSLTRSEIEAPGGRAMRPSRAWAEDALAAIGRSPSSRGEELSVEDYLQLWQQVAKI